MVDGVAELCSPVAGWDARTLGERLAEIERVRRRLEAATLVVLDEAERSGGFRDDAHVTVGGYARATVNWSLRDTTERVRAVQLKRLCPTVATEIAEGTVGVPRCSSWTGPERTRGSGDQIAAGIDELLGFAKELGFDGLRTVVRRWEQLTESMVPIAATRLGTRGRRASLSGFDDSLHLTAQFGVVQGTAMPSNVFGPLAPGLRAPSRTAPAHVRGRGGG